MSTITAPVVDTPSTAPVLDLDDGTGDPERLTHIVNQALPDNSVVAAIMNGTEVVAMCGHRFVPYRDPERYPVCRPCREALAALP